ncbi:MAG: chemotaxis protein CheD [Desulfobacca sp. 4484_104]|nr:MAG: chemotaxis protein CheD [Desulfobacca sp. 4484_104]RLA89978.1 MAG: chemotaxis protein CheD [Deltaproteobacteria bacterium]
MQITVGVADMQVTNNPQAVLVTHSLGSCMGVAVYDPQVRVGGILHYMLPEASLDGNKSTEKPLMFADTGIPLLFKECYRYGAVKSRMIVKIAGGSQIMDSGCFFNIGKRNYAALRKIFLRNNVLIKNEDIGGFSPRTLYLQISTGKVWVKITGEGEKLL